MRKSMRLAVLLLGKLLFCAFLLGGCLAVGPAALQASTNGWVSIGWATAGWAQGNPAIHGKGTRTFLPVFKDPTTIGRSVFFQFRDQFGHSSTGIGPFFEPTGPPTAGNSTRLAVRHKRTDFPTTAIFGISNRGVNPTAGVRSFAIAGSGWVFGGEGLTGNVEGVGVKGTNIANTGPALEIFGETNSSEGTAGLFVNSPDFSVEVDTDRPGTDYRNFALSEARPDLCEQACANEANCAAYTYVKPGPHGQPARCWLKSGAPGPIHNQDCVSGVRLTVNTPRAEFVGGLPESALPEIQALVEEGFELVKASTKQIAPTDAHVVSLHAKTRLIASKYNVNPNVVDSAIAEAASKRLILYSLERISSRYAVQGKVSKSEFVDSFSPAFGLDSAQTVRFRSDLDKLTPNESIDLLAKVGAHPANAHLPHEDLPDMAYFAFDHAGVAQVVSCSGHCLQSGCFQCALCGNRGGVISCEGDHLCENCVWEKYSECWNNSCCIWCWMVNIALKFAKF